LQTPDSVANSGQHCKLQTALRNNLANSVGGSDLFISFNIDNEWTLPINLGEPINSNARESCPYVTTNGKFFIFSSTRLIKEYQPNPLESIRSFKEKSESYDNGRWNIFYNSKYFIEKLREEVIKTKPSAN
jgi:hypothetical protein